MRMSDISHNKILLLIGLISAVVLILAVVSHSLNLSFFIQLLFDAAQEFARKGFITSDFMPVGYSGFLGSCMKVGGVDGIPACQAFIYIGILFAAFWFLELRGVRGIALALGILVISLHPMLLLNIWRIHDGNATILLLLGFLAASISYTRSRNTWSVLALGIFAGLLITVRQNAILLLLPALFLLWDSKQESREASTIKNDILGRVGMKYLGRAALFLVSALVIMSAVNITTKQTPFFFGQQGLYNFFSGTNEYASQYLRSDYSGENSLKEALTARGFPPAQTFNELLSFPSETYKQLALDYIKSHPLEYVKLTALKFFTLFRPGYHMAQNFTWNSLEGLKRFSKIVLATPFFIWIFFVYKTRKNFFDRENLFMFLVILLYCAPFFIANADPRYRFPLDIIFIADSFCRAKKPLAA